MSSSSLFVVLFIRWARFFFRLKHEPGGNAPRTAYRIIDEDLRHYNTAHAVFRPKKLTAKQLERFHRWMYKQFYSWENILRRWPVSRDQVHLESRS